MRRKFLIVLSFLLLLYITSLNFTMSYDVSPILERQNMTKEFSPSTAFTTNVLVASGSNHSDWNRSLSIDSLYFESVPASSVTLDFTNTYEGKVEGVEYAFYGLGGSGVLKVWNGSLWNSLKTITTETWYNGSFSLDSYSSENVTFLLTGYTSCDYLQAQLNGTLTEWHNVANATLMFDIPGWNIIISAIIRFATPANTVIVNALVIFLGLLMIPGSTLYLAKGGKDELTARKFFFFCIGFMMGWALLIGGITP